MSKDKDPHPYEKNWAKAISDGDLSWNQIADGYRERSNHYHFRLSSYFYLFDDPKDSARDAERDVYGCWWRFLQVNNAEYPPKPIAAEPEQAALFEAFGDLGDDFQTWWVETGSAAFAEKRPEPFIRLVDPADFKGGDAVPDYITVRIPMAMRRERILRQLRVLLEALKPGEQARRVERSTAKKALHPRDRYHPEHYDNLLELWIARRQHPEDEWWHLAKRLRMQGDLMVLADDPPAVASSKRRELTAKVQRMHRQAERMMWHALRGRFPCDEPIPGEAD